MAGERVPVVLLPRFSTFVGSTTFTTHVLDVSAYSELQVTAWRGPAIGSGTIFGISTQESTDRENWPPCFGPQDDDPGADTEVIYSWTLNMQWFRLQVMLVGTNPGVTCWVQGYLIKRER
jgi:hypothetical protein